MKIRSFTKHLCLVLALVLLLGLAPQRASSAQPEQVMPQSNQTDLAATIEEQIRAFVIRLNRPDADDIAAAELAQHGLSGNGEKLVVDKTHALTATLYNAEMTIQTMIESCTAAIMSMEQLQQDSLPKIFGYLNWLGEKYSYKFFTIIENTSVESWDWELTRANPYTGKSNSYDNSLEWMAGKTAVDCTIERIAVTDTEATYRVYWKIRDRFDFSTASGDQFKDWISGIGEKLFREFDWESVVTFELTVPYSCSHSTGMYRWTYDAATHSMIADESEGYVVNQATQHSFQNSSGSTSYYYELEDVVRLRHNQPWVLEYDAKNLRQLTLAPLEPGNASTQVRLTQTGGQFLLFRSRAYVKVDDNGKAVYHDYGTMLSELYSYSKYETYTFRLENVIASNGGNMVYLTVLETATGKVLVDKIPMDDYYYTDIDSVEKVLKNTSNDYLSGKDIYISFIGNLLQSFAADTFELRIWENGLDGFNQTEYEPASVTDPTCTEGGYTTYTCSACGHSYNSDFTDPVGHSFGSWSTENSATCDGTGTEGRDCHTCGLHETRETEAVGHIWDEGKVIIAPTEDSTGVKQIKCQVCGKQTTQTIPVLGHTHKYKKDVTHPTCLEGGSTTFTCECGDTYVGDYTDPKGHNYKKLEVAPTCLETGYTSHTCTRCGDSYTDSETPISDHNWNAGEVVVPATEQTTGVRMYTCIYCGETRTEVIPLVPHMHKYAPTVTEPTCTTPGYTTNTCACGDSYVDNDTEPLPHPYGEDGLCTVCGAKEPEPVEPEPTDPPPTEPTEPAPTDPPRPKPEPVRPSKEERHQVVIWLIIAGCMGFVCVLCTVIVLIFQFRKIPKRKKPKKDEKKSDEKPAEKIMKK